MSFSASLAHHRGPCLAGKKFKNALEMLDRVWASLSHAAAAMDHLKLTEFQRCPSAACL